MWLTRRNEGLSHQSCTWLLPPFAAKVRLILLMVLAFRPLPNIFAPDDLYEIGIKTMSWSMNRRAFALITRFVFGFIASFITACDVNIPASPMHWDWKAPYGCKAKTSPNIRQMCFLCCSSLIGHGWTYEYCKDSLAKTKGFPLYTRFVLRWPCFML